MHVISAPRTNGIRVEYGRSRGHPHFWHLLLMLIDSSSAVPRRDVHSRAAAVNMAGHGFAPVAGFVIDGAPGSARAPFREEFMMVEVT